MIKRLPQLFDFSSKAPEKYRSNFRNLYADVAWFGILNGSTIAFLPIYVTRLGANPGSVGIITAAPAIVALIISLPLGIWFSKRNTSRAVFLTAVASRIFYLFLCLYPWFFPQSQPQVTVILLSVFIMSIPGTALNLGFNALLGEAVPIEWRGHVAGIRGAYIALATAISSLTCGWILNHIEFPFGYQVVFLVGFLGAALSTYALWKVRPFPEDLITSTDTNDKQDHWFKRMINLDVLKGDFNKPLFLLVLFHLALYLPSPIFPVYQVRVLEFPDRLLGIGTSVFYLAYFFGSLQLEKITHRWSNKIILGVGGIMLGCYPFLLRFAFQVPVFLLTCVIGGLAWTLAGGILFNYLLEKVPEDKRPAYLAWFSLGSNAAILCGSLLGPVIASWVGLAPALILFASIRALSGILILRWG